MRVSLVPNCEIGDLATAYGCYFAYFVQIIDRGGHANARHGVHPIALYTKVSPNCTFKSLHIAVFVVKSCRNRSDEVKRNACMIKFHWQQGKVDERRMISKWPIKYICCARTSCRL